MSKSTGLQVQKLESKSHVYLTASTKVRDKEYWTASTKVRGKEYKS